MPRLFIGSFLPDDWIGELSSFIEKSDMKGLAVYDPSKWQTTLLFIGDVAEQRVHSVEMALSSLLENTDQFNLEYDAVVQHPEYDPKMVWCRFKRSAEFKALRDELFKAIAEITPVKAPRDEAIPHVTLGRYRSENAPKQTFNFNPELSNMFTIKKLTLVESHLEPTGSIYTPIKEFELVHGQNA